jgi:hypothetical protein
MLTDSPHFLSSTLLEHSLQEVSRLKGWLLADEHTFEGRTQRILQD